MNTAAAPPIPMDSAAGRRRRRGLFRRGPAPVDAGHGAMLEALRTEVVLLREENARLKAAEHQRPGLSELLRHSRSITAPMETREDIGDEAAHLLVESLVMRESLLTACRQIIESLRVVEAELEALEPPPQ